MISLLSLQAICITQSALDLALRFAREIFCKSSGAFWPKDNLISMRSNHTRETSHFITLIFEAMFAPYMLTADGRPLLERLSEATAQGRRAGDDSAARTG